jgi:hypothetical protein
MDNMSVKKEKYLNNFYNQLQNGINYYKNLMPKVLMNNAISLKEFFEDLKTLERKLEEIYLAQYAVNR